ncbi:hypothetical protein AVEN_85785-1 [Araneus ventricosus]|uniref:Uncharacterized protein n=1 Tax=Araneus ventricosus TaxID=182803 RepID=A0A4Y2CUW7_ARAVE|nr:hypothetical protein AVEN_42001-1 [Araneus ventricosus]GBM08262.1 hypothetical protein AVEN_85785-1 [Araneus ventricosus]
MQCGVGKQAVSSERAPTRRKMENTEKANNEEQRIFTCEIFKSLTTSYNAGVILATESITYTVEDSSHFTNVCICDVDSGDKVLW